MNLGNILINWTAKPALGARDSSPELFHVYNKLVERRNRKGKRIATVGDFLCGEKDVSGASVHCRFLTRAGKESKFELGTLYGNGKIRGWPVSSSSTRTYYYYDKRCNYLWLVAQIKFPLIEIYIIWGRHDDSLKHSDIATLPFS